MLALVPLALLAAQDKPTPTFDEIIKMRVVYTVPGMDRAVAQRDLPYRTVGGTTLKMDAYLPPGLDADARRPAVIFIHGGPIGPAMSPKDWGSYRSYGELVAASGMVAITFNHRFYGGPEVANAGEDVSALIDHVRASADRLHVDRERLALWAFSGGGTFLSAAVRDRPPFVRCLVSYYAVLDNRTPRPGVPSTISDDVRKAFSPAAHLATAPGKGSLPPILIARAGRDDALLNASVDVFMREALAANAPVELVNHPTGQHGFDILDNDARSREIIGRTFDFLKTHLRSVGDAPPRNQREEAP